MALRLLRAAARRYRIEGSVVELARLRVNEAVVSFRDAEEPQRQRTLNEEIVLLLSRLEELESPEPPFACLPADGLLTAWMSRRSFLLGGAEADSLAVEAEPANARPVEVAKPEPVRLPAPEPVKHAA
jgi:hypothetical protein